MTIRNLADAPCELLHTGAAQTDPPSWTSNEYGKVERSQMLRFRLADGMRASEIEIELT